MSTDNVLIKSAKYGKAECRVLKMDKKNPTCHNIRDFNARVLLSGDFDASFSKADNSLVVPTDTVKNTIYVLAKDNDIPSIEEFALVIGAHFLNTYNHVSQCDVYIEENLFERIHITQKDQNRLVPSYNSFMKLLGTRFVQYRATRKGSKMWSGIKDLHVLKTNESGFENFWRDKYTTLQPTNDRVFRTEVFARWKWPANVRSVDYNGTFDAVRQIIFDVFAGTYSKSVQDTIYVIAKTALNNLPQIDTIHIRCPNIHCITVNSPVPTKDPNSVLQVTTEPHGLIQGKFSRKTTQAKL